MLETFPRKSGGGRLSARHVNKLSNVCRRDGASRPGGNLAGYHGTFRADAPLPPGLGVPVEISGSAGSGLYLCKILYCDHSSGAWVPQDQEWPLDANVFGLTLAVGDVLYAGWHNQRRMFVPVSLNVAGSQNPLVDAKGDAGVVLKEAGEDSLEVDFWLERRADSQWNIIDGRPFWINMYYEETNLTASGVGFVTFLARDGDLVRLSLRAGAAMDDVTVEYGAVRLEALAQGGRVTIDVPAPAATQIHDLEFKAEVNNADGAVRWPKFEVAAAAAAGDAVKITTPGGLPWTVAACFTVTVSTLIVSSGSSTSSLSESSISASSSSVSTSSKSTSASSVSTSSESSVSSTSSSWSSTSSSSQSSTSSSSSTSTSSDISSTGPPA